MDSDKAFADLLAQIRSEVRDEIEEEIRKETRDAIIEYFTEEEGWPSDAAEYREQAAENIREAYDRSF